jgi:uncharacterized protein (DUF433 family)
MMNEQALVERIALDPHVLAGNPVIKGALPLAKL